jgi:hypothetical protein
MMTKGRKPPIHALARPGVIGGLLLAFALPFANLVVAFLWERQIVIFDPDGAVIGALQGTFLWELLLGPLGIVAAGRSAAIRSRLTWFALFVVAAPVLAWLWFLGVASVGALAGEPF